MNAISSGLLDTEAGIPIQLSAKTENEKKAIIEGYLLLITTDSLLIFDKRTNLITESRSETSEVAHAAGSLRRLPFSLPHAP
ncbi:hypothetical protein [Cupriavidus sp. UYPR2.512]|uniref:hypothetical protein n=1 Tax=Cupriavidus sp. UYPR2.512 TaxID=1080187 RepID=UPI0012FA0C7A|nr:hypothetical protein KAF44_21320 [Cupriavidus necator]